MPCPFFEPRDLVENRTHANARLPLIAEYNGFCHAEQGAAIPAPTDMRFGCNHGYSRDSCTHFPRQVASSALRYSIVHQSGEVLDLVCIEETGYTPLKWHSLRYVTASNSLATATTGTCMAAQALAFCRAYLQQSKSVLHVNE